MMENEWEKLYVAAFEDGGRGHKQRNVSSLWKLEKTRKYSPLGPADTLILAHWSHVGLLTYRPAP